MRYHCGNIPNLGDEVATFGFPKLSDLPKPLIVNWIGLDMGIDCIAFQGTDRYPTHHFTLRARLIERELRTCPVLFLDIDGVLNGHDKKATGYSGINADRVEVFNTIVRRVPDLKLVISSAWRYLILQGSMTLKGFETMLQIHGMLAHGRVAGHTEADGPLESEPSHFDAETWNRNSLAERSGQIAKYVAEKQITRYAVVDDLKIDAPNFVQTNGEVGLTPADADRLVEMLTR